MKREFVEDKQQDHLAMFFHQHNHKLHQETESPIPHRNEDDSLPQFPPPPHDGATIETVRRPRGRPPGSKNKPKQTPIITTSDSDLPLCPYILEILPGNDIIASATTFCRKRGTGLCIINGNGTVSNVTLKQPTTTPAATVTFHGHFEVLSITATILPFTSTPPSAFAVSVAGQRGQVVGGLVVGPLVAASKFYLIASVFNWPSVHVMLPNEEPADGGRNMSSSPQGGSGDGDGTLGESPNYCNYQSNSDVIWAPTARTPPQPPLPPY